MRKFFIIATIIFSSSCLSAQSVDSDTIEWGIDELEWLDDFQETSPCDSFVYRIDSIYHAAEKVLLGGKDWKAMEGFHTVIKLWEDSVANIECDTIDYYLNELYVWSFWQEAWIWARQNSMNAFDCCEKIILNWIDSSNTFFSNTIEIERTAARWLSEFYYYVAQSRYKSYDLYDMMVDIVAGSSHILDYSDSQLQAYAQFIDNLKKASEYYDLADVKFHSMEDILNTDYIEWVFRALGDSISLDNRNDIIGEFFYNHHTKLYKGLNNTIEVPGIDSVEWKTLPYAMYPMMWLNKFGRYEDALRYYDSIEDRFRNDFYVGAHLTTSYLNLGYYGVDIESMAHCSIINGEGTGYYSPETIRYSEIWMHYYKQQNELTIFLCDSALQEKKDPWLLLIRGICNNRLADRASIGPKHDYYLERAYHDYAESLRVSDSMGNPQDPFPYALLGQHKKAVKIAEHNKDSLLTATTYSELAQIYCIVGERKKAQKSIRKSLEIDHSIERLSYVLTFPYLASIKEFLLDEIDKYVLREDGITLKRIETDTLMTFIKYKTQNSVMIVPCIINGVCTDKMLFDSGAEYLQISKVMAEEMRRNGTLSDDDFLCMGEFSGAFGGKSSIQPIYNFRTVKIGNIELHNVTGTVAVSDDAPLLLGQSVLANFIIEMNPLESRLTLKQIKYRR